MFLLLVKIICWWIIRYSIIVYSVYCIFLYNKIAASRYLYNLILHYFLYISHKSEKMVRYQALKGLYEVERTIGCGGFAKVKLATHVATGERVAIKIMDKVTLGDDLPRVKLELKALKSLSHEHICKLYQVIETEANYFIVMEYCSGGELFDHIVEKNRLSESESRMFFRQIVSAVAYLHSLGYAHRDLKPENVLLDKYQNLKLIDFGLCARPEGGMDSLLFTSCGSPTYAAPELVLGKQYLGPEVDVWAMGVLLYALLAGLLPFDDLNIDSLYKRILSGKYEEPAFMSKESLSLIKSMLQVDPKKRITVNELLSHPWLTLRILDPVSIKMEHSKCYDGDCVNTIAKHYQVEPDTVWSYLKQWKYDYHTATYLLLFGKKRRGSALKLHSGAAKFPLATENDDAVNKTPVLKNRNNDHLVPISNKVHRTKSPKTPLCVRSTPQKNSNNTPSTPQIEDIYSPSYGFVEPRKPSSIRKPQKRIRSPGPDDSSPVPHKKFTTGNTTPAYTPDGKRIEMNPETPGSARRVLGSIERSFHKVRHVLTPRKPGETLTIQPVSLTNKDLCNVSTTQCCDPEFVISELIRALGKKGIHCDRKGFTLRGKLEPTANNRFGGCSFELEICYLPNLGPPQRIINSINSTKSILKKGPLNFNTPVKTDVPSPIGYNLRNKDTKIDNNLNNLNHSSSSAFVGIRRKRLKGDSWCYKKVCEQVLALTATGFTSVTESAV